MKLYLHFGEITLIINVTDENQTLATLKETFIKTLADKHRVHLAASEVMLTLPDSNRPLDSTAKVTKLLKDKDDVEVKQKQTGSSTSATGASKPAVSPRPVAPPVASSGPPRASTPADPYADMPPLEPDVDDKYSSLKPPVRSSIRPGSAPAPSRSAPTRPTAYNDDELDEEEMAARTFQIGAKPTPRETHAPCSVCGDVLDFMDNEDVVECKGCTTTNIHLRIIDAQTDCGKCGGKILRRRGEASMQCEKCRSELVVVKCPRCSTPFVASARMQVMPCVQCGSQFARNDGLLVSTPPRTHYLINKDVNEPASFPQRCKWKKPGVGLNVVTQYYRDSSDERQAEIELCLKNNISNDYVDRIFLFFENDISLPPQFQSPKIECVRFGRRLKFEDAFNFCNKNLSGQLCIVTNSDIYFDHTLRYLLQMPMGGKALALSRVDVTKGIHLNFNEWTAPVSQDAWIFRAPMPAGVDANYFFGWLGCDNRIAYEMKEHGLHVTNPSLKLICRHVHVTEKRNYTEQNKVVGNYAPVPPTADF